MTVSTTWIFEGGPFVLPYYDDPEITVYYDSGYYYGGVPKTVWIAED